jgi:hypothetical protein
MSAGAKLPAFWQAEHKKHAFRGVTRH